MSNKTDLLDPFKPEPLETIFSAQAEFDVIGRRYREDNAILVGNTFTEQLQYNFKPPTFWERIQILIFGVPPHELLSPRPLSEAELIVASLESEPKKWNVDSVGKYYIKHANGIKIWIANGISCVRYYDCVGNSEFSKVERELIWEAYQDWLAISAIKVNTLWSPDVSKYAKARRSVMAEQV